MTDFTTKLAVVQQLQREHKALAATLAHFSPDRLARTPIFEDGWYVKDMIAHITAWESQLIVFLEMAAQGEAPHMPKGAAWNDFIPPFNDEHYALDKPLTISVVLENYQTVFTHMVQLIKQQSDDATDPFWVLWSDGVDPWWLLHIWVEHIHEHHVHIKQALGFTPE